MSGCAWSATALLGWVLPSLEIEGAYLAGLPLVAALLGLGLALGTLTGLFGVGGGFVTVPLLNVLFGIPYSLAKGSGLSCILGTGASGLMRHCRTGHVAVKTMLIIGGGAACGAMLGGELNDYIEQVLCGGDQGTFRLVMHPLYMALLLLAAWLVYRDSPRRHAGLTLLQRLPVPPKIRIRLTGHEAVSLPGLCYIGLLIGVLTGLLGVGGGVLMMPLLLSVVGMNAKQAIGTSLGVVLFASAAGTVKYGLTDNVHLGVTMALLVGSTLGVQIGAYLCDRLRAARIRRYFALLVLAVVIMVAVDFINRLANPQG